MPAAADRNRPLLRASEVGFSLAPYDVSDRAHGAGSVPRVHSRADDVVELTGSRRAQSPGGYFSLGGRDHGVLHPVYPRSLTGPTSTGAIAPIASAVGRARNLATCIGIAISLAAALGLLDGPIAALWGGS